LTFINVFTVEPGRQQSLVDLLTDGAEQSFRHLPGFVSVDIHRRLDGNQVFYYAQWRSKADFEGPAGQPGGAPAPL
jgi:heme-degrading monooxygenase HmoA